MKRKQIAGTIILVFVLVVVLIAGISGIALIQKNKEMDLSNSFNTARTLSANSVVDSMHRATGFADKLCVTDRTSQYVGDGIQPDESGGLFSLNDGSILYAANIYDKIYPASITKIMTGILACKYGNLDDTVTINWQDLELESGSQVCGFKIGDRVTMNELLHGLLVHSGNDAAMAIARQVGGSSQNFVEMMNAEAVSIGATGTHFVNPSGLHDDNHYTTVYDIYLMLNEALQYRVFSDIMQLSVYDLQYLDSSGNPASVNVDSTDHYLTKEILPPKDVTVLGGKTGTTSEAGNCLALVSQNAYGNPYISIVVKAQSKDLLYSDMNKLLSQINN